MDVGAAEDTEVEVMDVSVVVAVVDEDEVVEGAMFIIHMNFTAGADHLWQMPMYTLQTNGGSYARNKRIIFNK